MTNGKKTVKGEFPNKATQFSSDRQPEKNGRPKGSISLAKIIREVLERELDITDPVTQKKIKKSAAHVLVLKLLQKGTQGDLRAIEQLFDRWEGKPKQAIETTDNNINIKIVE